MITDKTFLNVIGFVLDSEGGYTNHPDDPGGPTMRGIAWNYNAGWLTANGYTKQTLHTLTKEDAQRCYYERYWLPSNADGLTDIDLAYLHLDSAVQHGVGKAKEFLRNLPKNPKDYDFSDGKNMKLAVLLFGKYFVQRLRYYAVCRNFASFGRGWMNRSADIIDNALDN